MLSFSLSSTASTDSSTTTTSSTLVNDSDQSPKSPLRYRLRQHSTPIGASARSRSNSFSYYAMSDMTSSNIAQVTSSPPPTVPSKDAPVKGQRGSSTGPMDKMYSSNTPQSNAMTDAGHHSGGIVYRKGFSDLGPTTDFQRRPQSDTVMEGQISRGLGFESVPGNPPGITSKPGHMSGAPDITISTPASAVGSRTNSRSNTPHPPIGTGANGKRTRPVSEILSGQTIHGLESGRGIAGGVGSGYPYPSNQGSYVSGMHHGHVDTRNILSPEAEVIDRWFDDLGHYDRTLEQMAHTKMDSAFLEELRAMVTWFQAISDCERTTAVYSLVHHLNPVQVRFFVTVLRQMTKTDPLSSLMDNGSERGPQLSAPQQRYPMDRPASAVYMEHRHQQQRQPGMSMGPDGNDSGVGTHLTAPYMSERYRRHSSDELAIQRSLAAQASQNYASATSAGPAGHRGGGAGASSRYGQSPNIVVDTSVTGPKKADMASNWRPSKPRTAQASPTTPTFSSLPPNISTRPDSTSMPADARQPPNLMSINTSSVAASNTAPKAYSPLTLVPPSHNMSWGSRRNSYDSLNSPIYSSASPNPIMDGARGARHAPHANGGAYPSNRDSGREQGYHGQQDGYYRSNGYRDQKSRDYASATRDRDYSGGRFRSHSMREDRSDAGTRDGDSAQGRRPRASSRASTGGGGSKEKGKIPDRVDLELCSNIPMWLRSLRLHKYTAIFEDMNFRDMIILSDEQLEEMGVAALGARRKMLKVFEAVKEELEVQDVGK